MAPVTQRLIVFTRYPEPGRTKTRLIPHFGAECAAALQREWTEQTASLARDARGQTGCDVEVRITGGPADRFQAWLGSDLRYREQAGGDLGERMENAFADAFTEGCERVVLIGIDCPFLQTHHLRHAFSALATHGAVLGPAEDGGYTLIGLSAQHPDLFRDMEWSTATVFETTRRRLEASGRSLALLPRLPDIDRPEDVVRWKAGAKTERRSPTLSVIIPTLNCADTIPEVLASVHAQPDAEAIVADGGSEDDTMLIASRRGATVVRAPRGRAGQMNAGADLATTDRLLFLHGDTVLPEHYAAAIHPVLARADVSLGAFELGIGAAGLRLRIVEWLANWRSRWRSLPYGDQALFLTRSRFVALGRFPSQPFLEDLELVRSARRAGRVVVAPLRVRTSASRW
ncbi:MAG: TIGR04282 family arsenosugar biosynthesis glycosyltransferase, partial [Planctomycetota bacterium]